MAQTHGVSGCGYNKEQQADGLQMGIYAAKNGVDHVMLLGDNFYGSGIHGTDESCRFKKTFEDIYNARFVIERMERVEAYGASDRKSMLANNTSAFNCRPVSGTSTWSQHSYGGAIDINPFWNPWVKGTRVDPKEAVDFVDRTNVRPGMITQGDAVVTAFTSRGWGWGGNWRSLKDYQHMSANGK